MAAVVQEQLALGYPAPRGLLRLVGAMADAAGERQDLSLGEARLFVVQYAATDLTGGSLDRYQVVWRNFERFARVHDVHRVDAIGPDLVRTFVDSRTSTGRDASGTVRHLRRSGLRYFFRVLRQFSLLAGDPTIDLALPARTYPSFRALTDRDVEVCRAASVASLQPGRLPVVWALAEAGATPTELGQVGVADLRLDSRWVWIAGSAKTAARWARLTPWGCTQLARRARAIRGTAEALAFEQGGSEHSRRTGAVEAVQHLLNHARSTRVDDLRPASIRAWLGSRILQETGRIECVATGLGLDSLDRAVELVGIDWQASARPEGPGA